MKNPLWEAHFFCTKNNLEFWIDRKSGKNSVFSKTFFQFEQKVFKELLYFLNKVQTISLLNFLQKLQETFE
jgi:hypothetical protein